MAPLKHKRADPTSMASIQDTPEFKVAVETAVHDIMQRLAAGRAPEGAKQASGDGAWAQGLAMAIAEISDQGAGRKRVSPQILKQRADARALMTELLIEARAAGAVPVYELRNKVFLDEVLVEPIYIDPASKEQRATQIEWRGVPNDVMVPVNEVAKGIFKAFMDSIGSVEREDYDKPALGVTAGGLVIKSQSSAVRPASVMRRDDPRAAPEAGNGLSITHKNRGGQYVERHVLGTVAPPARQTA